MGKRQDPLGAAVGGYFLLQSRSSVPIDWLRNLADLNGWLADGAILYAYSLLSTGAPNQVPDAIKYLLKGAQRGYPVFRRGVDLFLDACRLLRSPTTQAPAELEECIDLFAAVRASSTCQSAFTTFFGERPDEPRARAKVLSQAVSSERALPKVVRDNVSDNVRQAFAGVRALSRRS